MSESTEVRTVGAAGLFRRAPVLASAVWAANWLLLTLTGQPYSTRVLYAGWQFLPVEAIDDDLPGSIWNLHIQPPGWNIVVGVVQAWSPLGLVASHRLISLALGMVLAGCIAATLVRLGASTTSAVVLTVLATINSQVMANAFEPRYDLAVTTGLAVVVWTVVRAGSEHSRWFVWVSVAATTLVMTRALYHPIWLVVTLAGLAWLFRGRIERRHLALAAAVPVVFAGGWIVKNEIVFGHATMSTWTGMNMLRAVVPAVDEGRLAELREDGVVSEVTAVGFFRWYAEYAPVMPDCGSQPGDPLALSMETREIPADLRGPLDGPLTANFNFECYIAVYDQAGADARDLIEAEPTAWLRGRAWAVNNWFEVPRSTVAGESPLWKVESVLSRVALLGAPHPGLPSGWEQHSLWVHTNPISVTLIVVTSSLLAAAAVSVRRRRSDPDDERLRVRQATLLTATVIVGWTALAGICFELGEQGRFRSATDPLVLALGGLALVEWVSAGLRRRRP